MNRRDEDPVYRIISQAQDLLGVLLASNAAEAYKKGRFRPLVFEIPEYRPNRHCSSKLPCACIGFRPYVSGKVKDLIDQESYRKLKEELGGEDPIEVYCATLIPSNWAATWLMLCAWSKGKFCDPLPREILGALAFKIGQTSPSGIDKQMARSLFSKGFRKEVGKDWICNDDGTFDNDKIGTISRKVFNRIEGLIHGVGAEWDRAKDRWLVHFPILDKKGIFLGLAYAIVDEEIDPEKDPDRYYRAFVAVRSMAEPLKMALRERAVGGIDWSKSAREIEEGAQRRYLPVLLHHVPSREALEAEWQSLRNRIDDERRKRVHFQTFVTHTIRSRFSNAGINLIYKTSDKKELEKIWNHLIDCVSALLSEEGGSRGLREVIDEVWEAVGIVAQNSNCGSLLRDGWELNGGRIRLRVQENLRIGEAEKLKLILDELMVNSIKRGRNIRICARRSGAGIELVVRNDVDGPPSGWKEGGGLDMIKTLAELWGWKFEWEVGEGKFEVALVIPGASP